MFIVFTKFSKNLQCLFYNIFSALCENNYERPLPLFTPVSPWPPLPHIRIVRLCSTYERFPPMGTHFKLRARHLGVRAPLISADNKGKQKPMPPAYNIGVLPPATTCPACPGILFGGKRCNSSVVAASAAHASPEHISSRADELPRHSALGCV